MGPRVSVIIVNWNRADDVVAAVRELERIRDLDLEVVVVDNGSTDDSVQRLSRFESIQLISLPENLGPCKSRNIGVAACSGEYLLFLDSDAVIEGPALRALVARMDREADLGIIGCRIVHADSGEPDQWIYAQPQTTHWRREFETYSFSAATALVRREAFIKAGGFWDDMVIYNEEVEMSIRIWRAGYRIIYYPDAVAKHHCASSGRGGNDRYWYYQARNWIWIFYRHYPWLHRWRKITTYSVLYLFKGMMSGQLRACAAGLYAGLAERSIIRRFEQKLTRDEVSAFERLNHRTHVRLSR